MQQLLSKRGFICDMDGVLYHGERVLPGVAEFIEWLYEQDKRFLFLTNASDKTPLELHQKLQRMGIDVDPSHFYTSALATAAFLRSQAPGCSAYVIGDHGLHCALYDAGISITDVRPDYVVVGETNSYNFDQIQKAMNLVNAGARLIATNYDITGPIEGGIKPACRALTAPIEAACGKRAYYVGKPNPLMMRTGLQILGVHSSEAAMIGDRMDTDIVAGVETGLDTVLVLSGVTDERTADSFPYRPRLILSGVGQIPGGNDADALNGEDVDALADASVDAPAAEE
ncbi:MAG: HAD-IIA family hydrolase [Coriobacteriia bacterium]|nr:HAD-IIA family hydrolase [Coriobacteriia bacterium]